MVCGMEFNPSQNLILHTWDPLVIEHYEIVREKSDWEGRRVLDIIHMVARKP